jgi:hypothetical protein
MPVSRNHETEEKRSVRARELCSQACRDSGIKISAWQHFTAWNKYVEGEIDQAQLNAEARQEIDQLSRSFGKYLVIEKDDVNDNLLDEEKKERAAQANRIYRKACKDAGVAVHFFRNFSTWSDFVNGKIGESEFYERAMAELKALMQ